MPLARLTRVVDTEGEYGPAGQKWIMLRAPFNESLLTALKDCFPTSDRRWAVRHKVWLINADCHELLMKLLQDGGYTLAWATLPKTTVNTPRRWGVATPDDYETLQIVPWAFFEVAQAAHRALILLHHPDRGGDPAKAAAINAAWRRVKETFEEPPF
jgi:hypothetical protein